MKAIIAGSRENIQLKDVEYALIECPFTEQIIEVVSGGANGVDKYGEYLAKQYNVPVKQFLADWDKYGKSAGYKRNEEMKDYADGLISVWDGKSKGTKNMIELMIRARKPVMVYIPCKDIIRFY